MSETFTDKFKVERKFDNGKVIWNLSGALDESTELAPDKVTEPLYIDLTWITHINSMGIQAWVQWAQTQKQRKAIYLEKCPVVMTRQFSIVRGFLVPNMIVNSFYTPFSSPDSSER